VIIVTPYLVRPVSGQLAVPTQGYRAPTDAQMVLGGQVFQGVSGPAAAAPPVAAVAVPGPAGPVAAPGFKL
jgi:pilus assembly protein CpaC